MSEPPESRSISIPGAARDPHPVIDRYHLLERIGEGGFGEVYVADQVAPVRRRVAIKVLKAGMDTKSVLARFEAERQALAMMDHPNIAKVLDAGETERGRPYFVMELVKGEPITDYCNRHTLTTKERLELFIPVCLAVQHAHQKGIIHRDLKPSNILVAIHDDRPTPKVIDFGIAKATSSSLTEKTIFTLQGQLIGTPAYMSPEQAEMSGLDVDTRTDVYSLGVILYELLAGEPPFSPETLRSVGYSEIQRIIREEDPPRPSTRIGTKGDEIARTHRTNTRTLIRELRSDLDWIVLKAIAKDRTHRYHTPNGLGVEIERYLNDEPVRAGPPSTTYRIRKFVRRHRLGVGIAGIGILALTILATTMTIQARRIAQERDRVRVEAETARQVSEFLIDLFEVSDPGEARGNTVTARQILDRGAEEIAETLGDRPLVRARLMGVMGRVYRSLGLYEPSRPLIEESLATRRSALGAHHPETLEAAEQLASLYWKEGKYEEAEPLFRETLAGDRRLLGDEDPRTLSVMNGLASLLSDRGQYDEAESLYVGVIEARRRVLGPDHRETLKSMGNLALLYWDEGRYDDAEPLYLETLETQRRLVGEDHPETLDSMNNLGILYYVQGRYDDAEALYREALTARRRVQGPEHPRTLGTMNNLALLYHYQKRYEKAEVLYRETLEAKRRVMGEEHHGTIRSRINLAALFADQGRAGEAESLYREALAAARRVLGEEHPETLTTRLNLAILYADEDRHAEAKPLLERTLAAQRRVLGDDHPEALVSLVQLARGAAVAGQHRQALAFLSEASDHGLNDRAIFDESDFDRLRGDTAFEEIVAAVKGRLEKTEHEARP